MNFQPDPSYYVVVGLVNLREWTSKLIKNRTNVLGMMKKSENIQMTTWALSKMGFGDFAA